MARFEGARGGPGAARAIRIYEIRGLTHENLIPANGFWFPVAPAVIGRAGSHEWTRTRIVGLGETAHRGGPNLSSIDFDGFFPFAYSEHLCRGLRRREDFINPDQACLILEKLRDRGAIFGLAIGGGDTELNEKFFIEEFTWTEEGRRPGDRLFSIRMIEWEPQQLKQRGGIKLPPVPRAYKIRPGEDLQDAALRIYGHVRNWKSLAAANGLSGADAFATSLNEAGRVAANAGPVPRRPKSDKAARDIGNLMGRLLDGLTIDVPKGAWADARVHGQLDPPQETWLERTAYGDDG